MCYIWERERAKVLSYVCLILLANLQISIPVPSGQSRVSKREYGGWILEARDLDSGEMDGEHIYPSRQPVSQPTTSVTPSLVFCFLDLTFSHIRMFNRHASLPSLFSVCLFMFYFPSYHPFLPFNTYIIFSILSLPEISEYSLRCGAWNIITLIFLRVNNGSVLFFPFIKPYGGIYVDTLGGFSISFHLLGV